MSREPRWSNCSMRCVIPTQTIPTTRAPRGGGRTVLLVRLSAVFCAACRGFCSTLSRFHPETGALCKRYSDDLEQAQAPGAKRYVYGNAGRLGFGVLLILVMISLSVWLLRRRSREEIAPAVPVEPEEEAVLLEEEGVVVPPPCAPSAEDDALREDPPPGEERPERRGITPTTPPTPREEPPPGEERPERRR